jgi:protein phosphatase
MMHLEAYARTDPGPVRPNNEDSMLVDLENQVFIVADGMGGHAAGEVASALAVEVLHRILISQDEDPEQTRLVRHDDYMERSDELRELLRYGMNQASIHIRQHMMTDPKTRGMGTTAVMLVFERDRAHVAHVGDSRAYLCRDNRLLQLTRDHTVVQQEIDAGRLTPDLAKLVPHKHILTQSVGFHGPVEPDTSTRVLQDNDVFILCSDGLTDVMTDADIVDVITANPSDMVADILVEEAIAKGTQDNVTVVAVFVGES